MRIVFSLVVGAGLLATTASAAVPETARVGAVHGQVVLQTGTSESTVAGATDLKAGDVLQLATDAKLTVDFADGGSVLVAGPAVLDLADLDATGRRLMLRSGAIQRAHAGRVALEVQTPDGASLVLQNATGSASVNDGATSFAKLGGAYAKVWQGGSAQDLSGTWSSGGAFAAMRPADTANAGGKAYAVGDTLRVGAGASESVSFSDGTTLSVVGPAELGFVQMDASGRRVMLRSGTISNAAVRGTAMEIQTPARYSLVLQDASGMARVSGGNVTFQKLGGEYAQVYSSATETMTPLAGAWSNTSGGTAPRVSMPAVTAPAVRAPAAASGGTRADRIAELEAEVARLRAELSNARAAGYSGHPAKYLELGKHVIAYRPADEFIVENTPGGGAKLTFDGNDFGIVTVGRDTNLFLWLGDYVEFDSNGQVVAFTGVSHLYDSLSTFFMWDNPVENTSDVSISRPHLR
jgi:hypothetical protein